MARFIGFSTIGRTKKFTLTDYDLIKRDLLNAFNIRQGELPGRPNFGTVIYDFLFENQIDQLQNSIQQEVQRVAAIDPRLEISQVVVAPQQNGFLIELELRVVNTTTAERLSLFFDLQQRQATYV
jgi:phage baseplate assembly protein W